MRRQIALGEVSVDEAWRRHDSVALRYELNLLSAQREAWDNGRKLFGAASCGVTSMLGMGPSRPLHGGFQADRQKPCRPMFRVEYSRPLQKDNDFDANAIEGQRKSLQSLSTGAHASRRCRIDRCAVCKAMSGQSVEFAEGLHFEGRAEYPSPHDVNLEIAESES